MALIYGVDPEEKVTPTMVRDAIIECFYQAHQEVLQDMYVLLKEGKIKKRPEEMGKEYIKQTIANYFIKVGGDFENPTKEHIMLVLEELREFAKGFRSPDIINKHYGEIMKLVEKMNE